MKLNVDRTDAFKFSLLLWAFAPAITSQLKVQEKATFKVGVFYDWDIPGGEETITYIGKDYVRSRLHFTETSTTIFDVQFVPYFVKDLSPFQVDTFFCQKILNRNISVVVLHTKNAKLTRYLAYLSSHFWIPSIGSTTKDPLLTEKNVYRSFLRTIAPETQQFQVVQQFLTYTGNAEAFVIVSDDTAHGLALEFFSKTVYGSIITIVNVETSVRQPEIVQLIMRIKSSIAKVAFLYCDLDIAKIILWTARDFRMFQNDFFWIVSEHIMQYENSLYMIPSRIYAIRTEGFQSVDDFFMDRLADAYALVHKAVASLSKNQLLKFLRKPENCSEIWAWQHGKELYRKLVSTTVTDFNAPIKLDSQGNRANYTHDVLYLLEAVNYDKKWSMSGKWIEGRLSLKTTGVSSITRESNEVGLPTLRAAVVEYPPLTMKSSYDPTIGCTQGIKCIQYHEGPNNFTQHCCYGLAIDVLMYVKSELQFEPLVYFVRDGNYGAKNVTSNQWNGIVRDLVTGEADISIDLMTNEARSEVVDFSQRWTEAGLALLVLVGEKKVDAIDFSFLDPFTMELWLGMVGIVNLYLVALWITDRLSPYGSYATRKRGKSRDESFDLAGSMWYSWGVCFDNQFVADRPKSGSSRAMAVCLAMFGLLCLTSYTANLTAHLVSDDTKPDITGIRDPKITAEDSKLTFGVVKSSFVDSYFELNQDPVMKSLFERMLTRNHLVKNFTDGVDRIKSRKLDIFISEILSLDYEVAKQKTKGYPRLQVVGASKTFADTGYSYSFRKNSTWKPKFDLVINKIKAENIPSELYKKWVRSGKTLTDELHEGLNEQSLSGVFFVGIALAVVSAMFLIMENKLFNMGLIYRHLSKFENGETYERGRRRFSVEVHRKLLEVKKDKKPENTEFPDISNYLKEKRKSRASIHALYNPVKTKTTYELEDGANSDSV